MVKKIREYIKYLKGPLLVPIPEELAQDPYGPAHSHYSKGPLFAITSNQYSFPKHFNHYISFEDYKTWLKR